MGRGAIWVEKLCSEAEVGHCFWLAGHIGNKYGLHGSDI